MLLVLSQNCKLVVRKELVEVSILHVLRDHAQRVAFYTHSQQANDVGVSQP